MYVHFLWRREKNEKTTSILTFSGAEKEAKKHFSFILWRRERTKRHLYSGQVLRTSINPNPFFIIRGFEPYPKSFSNRWKGLNTEKCRNRHFSSVLVSRDTR